MSRTVLFIAPNSWVVRNWIASGLIDRTADEIGLDVELASPFEDPTISTPGGREIRNHFIAAGYRGRNDIPAHFPALLYWIYFFRLRAFALEVENGSIQMMMLSRRRDAVHYAIRTITALFPRGSGRRRFIRGIIDSINPRHRRTGEVLDSVQPRALVVGTPGFLFLDQTFMVEARRRGIDVHCVVNSWDNMTSRGAMIRRPKTLMVWNEYMRDQAEEIHQYPRERTHVVGSLQFSRYRDPVSDEERKAVYDRLGLEDGSPYMLFLTGQHVPQYEAEDVERLRALLDRSEYAELPLVVRVHPQADEEPFEAIGHEGLILDLPPKFSAEGSGGSRFDTREMRAMAALLQNSTAVFSSWGTTALLEAAIFDRPIIQLRWMDVFWRKNRDQASRVHDFQRYLHLVPFDQTGCRLFSDSPETFLDDLNNLMNEPARHAEGRARAVSELATLPLEDAPSRVVAVLAGALGG